LILLRVPRLRCYDNYSIGWDLEGGEDAAIPDVTWLDPPEEEEVEE